MDAKKQIIASAIGGLLGAACASIVIIGSSYLAGIQWGYFEGASLGAVCGMLGSAWVKDGLAA
jgi:hypothetical protein